METKQDFIDMWERVCGYLMVDLDCTLRNMDPDIFSCIHKLIWNNPFCKLKSTKKGVYSVECPFVKLVFKNYIDNFKWYTRDGQENRKIYAKELLNLTYMFEM